MISIRPSAVDAPEAVALVRSTGARTLYAAGGYAEIPAHRDRRYAGHWFAEDLTPRPG
jgi:hypothetical protein